MYLALMVRLKKGRKRVSDDMDRKVEDVLLHIDRDLQDNPTCIKPVTLPLIEALKELTDGVEVDLDAPLGPES